MQQQKVEEKHFTGEKNLTEVWETLSKKDMPTQREFGKGEGQQGMTLNDRSKSKVEIHFKLSICEKMNKYLSHVD